MLLLRKARFVKAHNDSEMQMTADKLDRRIRELELIVAVYSAALELYKEKEKAEPRSPAKSTPLPRST